MKLPFVSLSIFSFITVSIFGMYQESSIYAFGFHGKLVVIISTIFLTFFFQINKIARLKIEKKSIPLILFLLYVFVGAIHGIVSKQVDSIEYFIYTNYFILTIIYLYSLSMFNLDIKRLLSVLHVALIVNFMIGFILIFPLNMEIYDYAQGGFGDKGLSAFLAKRTSFGLLSLFGVFVEFYLYTEYKRVRYLFLMFSYSALLFLSDNRTTILMLVVFFSLQIFYKIKKVFRDPYFRYLLNLFLLLGVVIFFLFSYREILDLNYESISSGRTMIWALAIHESTKDLFSIIFGNGMFSLGHYIPEKYASLSYHFQEVDILSMHSSYIEIFIASGVVGLIGFFVLIYRVWGRDSYLNSIVLSILLIGIFEGVIIMPTIPIISFFWLIVIISLKEKFKRSQKNV